MLNRSQSKENMKSTCISFDLSGFLANVKTHHYNSFFLKYYSRHLKPLSNNNENINLKEYSRHLKPLSNNNENINLK